MDEYGLEGSVNLLDNPQLEDKFLDATVPSWDVWDYTDFTSFTQPDERFLLAKSGAGAAEFLWQDITANIRPSSTYTVIFKGVIENDTDIEVVGGTFDIINPDDLGEIGSSTVSITGSAKEIYTVLRFQTAETLSGNPIMLRYAPQTLNTYIRFDKVFIKEGWLEISNLFTKSFFERSVRYNETTEVWEITSDNGVSWEQFGTSVSGDVYAAIADMVVSNVENGIQVYYTSGNKKLNFEVDDFQLTFVGDVSGSGIVTNLTNQTITIEVVDDSHNHTTATITDFVAATDAAIDGRINDGGVSSTDLWSAQKIDSEITALAISDLVGIVKFWSPVYFGDGSNGSPLHALIATNDVGGANTYLSSNYPGWVVADGSVPNDGSSPIWNAVDRYLPNLTDSRFLMGGTTAGSSGGDNDGHYHSNTLVGTALTAGEHTHTGNVGTSGRSYEHGQFNSRIPGEYWDPETGSAGDHSHTVSITGDIGDTGGVDGDAIGSNIPKYLSGFYIIKIK